jgi:RNA polymerase sigma factor (TIGR02999 family)
MVGCGLPAGQPARRGISEANFLLGCTSGATIGAEVTEMDNKTASAGPPAGARSSRELFEQVYQQLRAVAQERLRNERRDHTLQATALVHEAWIRLAGGEGVQWGGRAQFFSAAVEAMRRILIDHARKNGAAKRGGGRLRQLSSVLDLASDEKISDAIVLDDLISRLEREDPRAAGVVRLRFYTGLSLEEAAVVLGVSVGTIKNDWAYARAWLLAAWEESEREPPRPGAKRQHRTPPPPGPLP